MLTLRLRPKQKPGSGSSSFLPEPATFKAIRPRSNKIGFILVALVFFWFLNPLLWIKSHWAPPAPRYPPAHPYTSEQVIETPSKYIYPAVEHVAKLKELGGKNLVRQVRVRDADVPEMEKTVLQSLNVLDDKDPVVQKQKEEADNAKLEDALVKNTFKNHDKVVFRPKSMKNYPKAVIVTAVDFDRYSVDAITKIVQNRVDYGHQQNYGVYVRWVQEFIPTMNSLNFLTDKERAKWVRIYCLRAAMFAFPHAEWFWYFDEDGFVMNQKVDLIDYLVGPEALKRSLLLEQPVIPPDGLIKTYKNVQPGRIRLVFTQSDRKIESGSFIVKNDFLGRGLLDTWGDRLFLNYNNFPYGPESAITHVLQWHPFVLSRTAIVPARTINSKHSENALKEEAQDEFHYYSGDLVVQWSDCETPLKCEEILNGYHAILKKQQEVPQKN